MERKIRKINYGRKFLKRLSKLPNKIINEAQIREIIFKENVFDSRLNTHKLHGEDKNCWAFWINYSYRIKFIFISDDEVLFLDIGTHDIYK